MTPILLSYQVEPFEIKYYSVPYDTEEEYEIVCGLDGLCVNYDEVNEQGIYFLENLKSEWEISGRPDLTKYRTLVTTGWC